MYPRCWAAYRAARPFIMLLPRRARRTSPRSSSACVDPDARRRTAVERPAAVAAGGSERDALPTSPQDVADQFVDPRGARGRADDKMPIRAATPCCRRSRRSAGRNRPNQAIPHIVDVEVSVGGGHGGAPRLLCGVDVRSAAERCFSWSAGWKVCGPGLPGVRESMQPVDRLDGERGPGVVSGQVQGCGGRAGRRARTAGGVAVIGWSR